MQSFNSYHEENTCKVSKQWVQNCKRSCAHKIPMLNVDGWTDGRTNRRKLARLCLPAKAGATKSHHLHTVEHCGTINISKHVNNFLSTNPTLLF